MNKSPIMGLGNNNFPIKNDTALHFSTKFSDYFIVILVIFPCPGITANHAAVSPGWTGEASRWSSAGCQGPVVPDEAMSGRMMHVCFTYNYGCVLCESPVLYTVPSWLVERPTAGGKYSLHCTFPIPHISLFGNYCGKLIFHHSTKGVIRELVLRERISYLSLKAILPCDRQKPQTRIKNVIFLWCNVRNKLQSHSVRVDGQPYTVLEPSAIPPCCHHIGLLITYYRAYSFTLNKNMSRENLTNTKWVNIGLHNLLQSKIQRNWQSAIPVVFDIKNKYTFTWMKNLNT